jgi:hypothetical protein
MSPAWRRISSSYPEPELSNTQACDVFGHGFSRAVGERPKMVLEGVRTSLSEFSPEGTAESSSHAGANTQFSFTSFMARLNSSQKNSPLGRFGL